MSNWFACLMFAAFDQELGTRVEPMPRDIDARLYAYDPAQEAATADDVAEELSELAVAPH